MKQYIFKIFLVILGLLVSSCGAVISDYIVEDSNLSITPSYVRENPEEYIDENIIWGGVIIGIKNKEKGTTVEVFATPLAKSLRPTGTGTLGRFLIKTDEYLDPLIYSKNAMITVAGSIEGIETRKIDEMDYQYPIIKPIEIKLFKDNDDELEYYPYYNPYYRPYYYPYYYPW